MAKGPFSETETKTILVKDGFPYPTPPLHLSSQPVVKYFDIISDLSCLTQPTPLQIDIRVALLRNGNTQIWNSYTQEI